MISSLSLFRICWFVLFDDDRRVCVRLRRVGVVEVLLLCICD